MKRKCRAVTSPKKRTNQFVFLSWRLGNIWNLNFNFKFQVYPGHQDRKTNSFVCFLGKVIAPQFCLEIYWPLEKFSFAFWKNSGHRKFVLRFSDIPFKVLLSFHILNLNFTHFFFAFQGKTAKIMPDHKQLPEGLQLQF